MARKSKLFKDLKIVKKTAGKTALNGVITGGAFLAGKGALNLLSPKIENENMRKALGPIAAVAGMALEAFSENPQLAAVGRGLTVAGIDKSADTFIPEETKAKIGLSGVGNTPDKVVDGGEQHWEKVREEFETQYRKMHNNDSPGNDVPGAEKDATSKLI
jgi:hypothetical protein